MTRECILAATPDSTEHANVNYKEEKRTQFFFLIVNGKNVLVANK